MNQEPNNRWLALFMQPTSHPEKCDNPTCRKSLYSVCYDTKTVHGVWMYLCPHCYNIHGTANGMRLVRNDSNHWVPAP